MDDELLLDEEMESEFIDSDEIAIHDKEEEDVNLEKINERCRYWPACKNGDKCNYHHPTVTCK